MSHACIRWMAVSLSSNQVKDIFYYFCESETINALSLFLVHSCFSLLQKKYGNQEGCINQKKRETRWTDQGTCRHQKWSCWSAILEAMQWHNPYALHNRKTDYISRSSYKADYYKKSIDQTNISQMVSNRKANKDLWITQKQGMHQTSRKNILLGVLCTKLKLLNLSRILKRNEACKSNGLICISEKMALRCSIWCLYYADTIDKARDTKEVNNILVRQIIKFQPLYSREK